MILRGARRLARISIDSRAWRPQHAMLLWNQLRPRERSGECDDELSLRAAADWLCQAQDASPDGGISGRYLLDRGWTSSYPETTGYIIPTFLKLAAKFPVLDFESRAERCLRFLLSVQLPNGAFPAAEIEENTTEPSVFNTAQIIAGLQSWHEHTGEQLALDAAIRAADWLVSEQSPEGVWRSYVYLGLPTTYTAHASCWLARLGQYTGEGRYLEAAERHLDWVLSKQDPATGWFDLAGFSEAAHEARTAVTHTIGYTLWGTLSTASLLNRSDACAAVRKGAEGIAECQERLGWIPGILNDRWQGVAEFSCPTGNAQIALVWLMLQRSDGETRWLDATTRALQLVKRAQVMGTSDLALCGGIPGSDPIWGGYLYNALPNWAAKFFIDALLEKQEAEAKQSLD